MAKHVCFWLWKALCTWLLQGLIQRWQNTCAVVKSSCMCAVVECSLHVCFCRAYSKDGRTRVLLVVKSSLHVAVAGPNLKMAKHLCLWLWKALCTWLLQGLIQRWKSTCAYGCGKLFARVLLQGLTHKYNLISAPIGITYLEGPHFILSLLQLTLHI
jgi:hypothetical protein